jgi:hypothetical protein
MPRHRQRTIQNEKEKKNQRILKKTQQRSVSRNAAFAHPALLFPEGSLDRIKDARFNPRNRQNALTMLGQTVGNRSLQRMINNTSEPQTAIQRSTVQRGILDWIKKKIGNDPEGAVRSMNKNLDRASKILDGAASTVPDNPDLRKKIIRVKEGVDNLKSTTSGVVKVLDARDKIRKVWAFASAIESIPDDVASNPEQAAKAFGKVFSTAGDLGEMLPEGPWTPYFKFLQGAENFFSDMLYGLDPKKKPSNKSIRQYLP